MVDRGRYDGFIYGNISPKTNLGISNNFHAKRHSTACELLAEGVAAIFGPSTAETADIVASIADAVEVPHITAYWEREQLGAKGKPNEMTLNIYPDTETLSRAYAELLVDYTWKSYTIIYEDDDGLMRLKDILQIHDPQSSPITVRYDFLPIALNQLINTRSCNFHNE